MWNGLLPILKRRINMTVKKGTPKRDGSGKGVGANVGRGGCKVPKRPNQTKRPKK